MPESKNPPFSLVETRLLPEDEVESARILLREGLVEESKRTLYRILTRKPDYRPAIDLLKQIETLELKELFREDGSGSSHKRLTAIEDVDALIDSLDRDLGLGLKTESESNQKELWNASAVDLDSKARFDLGVAFYEMGCYADALRELHRAEKKIRIEESFLGETGLASVSLIAQCLVSLDRAFEAKAYLEPILIEPDLKHEDKLGLYYVMGLAEQALGQPKNALGWYQKINHSDPEFRDVQIKIRQLAPLKKKT